MIMNRIEGLGTTIYKLKRIEEQMLFTRFYVSYNQF